MVRKLCSSATRSRLVGRSGRPREKWAKCRETNRILASCQYPGDEVVFMDLEDLYLNAEGTIKPELFVDGTHLTAKGYAVMADALAPEIERLIRMGPVKSAD